MTFTKSTWKKLLHDISNNVSCETLKKVVDNFIKQCYYLIVARNDKKQQIGVYHMIRQITDVERLFLEGFSIGILEDSDLVFNINDGQISEIGMEEKNRLI